MVYRLRYQLLTLIYFIVIGAGSGYGQFCSCADLRPQPSPDYRSLPAGAWQVGIAYDYRHLNKLILNSTELEDESRQRSTRNLIVRVGYGITDRWLITAITGEVIKSVEIRLPTIGREKLVTSGVGDSYLLAGYTAIPWTFRDGRQLTLGGGLKIPTGSNNLSSDDIAIRYDMQPGTGSFAIVGWGDGIYSLNPGSPAHLRFKGMYKLNTANGDGIKAGDEFDLSAGVLFLPEFVGRLSGYLLLRHIGWYKDDSGARLDNTGGRWLFLGWNVQADLISGLLGEFNIEMPLTQHVNGNQLSPDFLFSLMLQYRLKR